MAIEDILDVADPEAIRWDNFDDAIIGTDTQGKLVYDIYKMVDILVKGDGMDADEAMEYIEFNILGAYVGEMTPVHVYIGNWGGGAIG